MKTFFLFIFGITNLTISLIFGLLGAAGIFFWLSEPFLTIFTPVLMHPFEEPTLLHSAIATAFFVLPLVLAAAVHWLIDSFVRPLLFEKALLREASK